MDIFLGKMYFYLFVLLGCLILEREELL